MNVMHVGKPFSTCTDLIEHQRIHTGGNATGVFIAAEGLSNCDLITHEEVCFGEESLNVMNMGKPLQCIHQLYPVPKTLCQKKS